MQNNKIFFTDSTIIPDKKGGLSIHAHQPTIVDSWHECYYN